MTRCVRFLILVWVALAVQVSSGEAQKPPSPTAPKPPSGAPTPPQSIAGCSSSHFTCRGGSGKVACCDSADSCKKDSAGTPFCFINFEICADKSPGQVVCDGAEGVRPCCPQGTACMYGSPPWYALWNKKPFIGCGAQCADPALQCGRECCTWTQQCVKDKTTGTPIGCGPNPCGEGKTLCGDPQISKPECCGADQVCVARPQGGVVVKTIKFPFIRFTCEQRGAPCKKSPGFVCGPSEAKGTCCLPTSTCHDNGGAFRCCPSGYTVNGFNCTRMANYIDEKGARSTCEPGFIPVWDKASGTMKCTPIPVCMRPEPNAPEICAPITIK